MPIYNNGTNSFVWNGTRYGVNTLVKFKDSFITNFRWMDQKICNKGLFYGVFFEGGKKMFQFRKYCPEEFTSDIIYPGCFSFTELELLDAIEAIEYSVSIEEVTACEPPFAQEKLNPEYKDKCTFFKYKDNYYGSGSKIYISDEFIEYYLQKTGKRLTKKIIFISSDARFDKNNKRKYSIATCGDMKIPGLNDYCFMIELTEDEFFKAIEFITDCHAIKYKDTDIPIVFIFWILGLGLIVLSFVIFKEPSIIIMIVLFGIYKIRKILLRQ